MRAQKFLSASALLLGVAFSLVASAAETVPADIAAAEKKVADLEAALQTPDVYKDATRVRDTMKELEAAKDALARLYQHWEEAVELNG